MDIIKIETIGPWRIHEDILCFPLALVVNIFTFPKWLIFLQKPNRLAKSLGCENKHTGGVEGQVEDRGYTGCAS